MNIEQTIEDIVRKIVREELDKFKEEQKPLVKESKYGDVSWVAETLCKSKATIYQYIHNPDVDLPYIKAGQKLLFDREKIYEWIQSGEVRTPSQVKEDALNYLTTLRKK